MVCEDLALARFYFSPQPAGGYARLQGAFLAAPEQVH